MNGLNLLLGGLSIFAFVLFLTIFYVVGQGSVFLSFFLIVMITFRVLCPRLFGNLTDHFHAKIKKVRN